MIQIILIVFNCHGFCETWLVFFLRNMTWPGNVTCRADMHFYKINCWFTLNLSKKDQWTKNTGPIDTGPIGQDQKHWTNRYWTNRDDPNYFSMSSITLGVKVQNPTENTWKYSTQQENSKPNWTNWNSSKPCWNIAKNINQCLI